MRHMRTHARVAFLAVDLGDVVEVLKPIVGESQLHADVVQLGIVIRHDLRRPTLELAHRPCMLLQQSCMLADDAVVSQRQQYADNDACNEDEDLDGTQQPNMSPRRNRRGELGLGCAELVLHDFDGSWPLIS